MENIVILKGNIIYSETPESLRVYENSFIVAENGKISGIFDVLPQKYSCLSVRDCSGKLIIPAFSDMHVHAPQYPQRGMGMDLLLKDWLNTYTFPQERRFADTDYASLIYEAFSDSMLRNGTLQACIFATIHVPASAILAEKLEKRKINALVGKVCMDRSAPDYLCENTEASLRDTETFISGFEGMKYARPILAPRFAPTCTRELLEGLGKIGRKYGLGVHTHLEESLWEAAEARRLFPECSCDGEIYERAGLLGNGPAVFAHYVFPSVRDDELLKKYRAVTVHCPDSTTNIIAGIMPACRLMSEGVQICLGSDIGAGANLPVFRQVSRAVQLSKLRNFYIPDDSLPVSFEQAFYMGTAAASTVFKGTGSLCPGSRFNALVIDQPCDPGSNQSPRQLLERFCYTGDDRNIISVFSDGVQLI